MRSYIPYGVSPAVLLPFDNDLAIDEAGFRKHLRDVAATDGISAITINAHSTEVASCSFDEQRKVLDIARDEIGARLPLVNGIWADGSLEAARIARMATAGGASALLVFPPAPFTLGQSPQMALAHFSRIAEASDLSIIVFQYPIASGQGYPPDTLLRMCEEIPNIRAIKDWCGNLQQHEWHVRTLQSLPRPVNVLSTHSAWLLSSLVLGCNGLLSGSGSVIPDLQSALFRAVRSNDLEEARRNQRSHLPARPGILFRAVGGYAQPHEGGAGATRPPEACRRAAATHQDRRRGNRAHPPGAARVGPAAPESQRRVGALASGAMRDTHRTGSCGAMRLLVAVRHLNVFPKSSLLARNNSKR